MEMYSLNYEYENYKEGVKITPLAGSIMTLLFYSLSIYYFFGSFKHSSPNFDIGSGLLMGLLILFGVIYFSLATYFSISFFTVLNAYKKKKQLSERDVPFFCRILTINVNHLILIPIFYGLLLGGKNGYSFIGTIVSLISILSFEYVMYAFVPKILEEGYHRFVSNTVEKNNKDSKLFEFSNVEENKYALNQLIYYKYGNLIESIESHLSYVCKNESYIKDIEERFTLQRMLQTDIKSLVEAFVKLEDKDKKIYEKTLNNELENIKIFLRNIREKINNVKRSEMERILQITQEKYKN